MLKRSGEGPPSGGEGTEWVSLKVLLCSYEHFRGNGIDHV